MKGRLGVFVEAISETQRHTGILVLDGSLKKLHLRWNRDLCYEETTEAATPVIEPKLPEKRVRQLAAYCRSVADSNGRDIAYGFSPPWRSLDPSTGSFQADAVVGLTCATFVLAVFSGVGVELVQAKTWPPPSEEDKAWFAEMVMRLESDPMTSSEHVERVKNEKPNARFPPEQVAAATGLPGIPVPYALAKRKGDAIVRLLNRS